MINKLENNNLSFKGTIIQNELLKNTINSIKQRTIIQGRDISYAENLADALEYIINETPDTDVFELRKEEPNTNDMYPITLYKNEIPIKTHYANTNIPFGF